MQNLSKNKRGLRNTYTPFLKDLGLNKYMINLYKELYFNKCNIAEENKQKMMIMMIDRLTDSQRQNNMPSFLTS